MSGGPLSGLQAPLLPGQPWPLWQLLAGAAAVLLLTTLLVLALRRRSRRNRSGPPPVPPIRTSGATVQPAPASAPMAVGNVQGLGRREEQQDAFAVSPLTAYPSQGLLAVLCDGMGGLADGQAVAQTVVEETMAAFPYGAPDPEGWNAWLRACNERLFAAYGGRSGSTLVTAYLFRQQLWFWCVGDSDLYLMRDGALYAVNARQEYAGELLRRVLEDGGLVGDALHDPQAGALSEYLGNRSVLSDFSRRPFPLQPDDRLLLCSDGVTDALSVEAVRCALLQSTPQACCDALEQQILAAAKPEQDNYTAIVIDCARL